jgi:RHH-type proline utilization regulon transcriptional repressor/proline dehydrogenase/delta 1-pyrroline-5-carboxylate dehydrogenase
MGKSSFGPGIKAGGPNYVAPLMRFADWGEGVSAVPAPRAGSSPTPARIELPSPPTTPSPPLSPNALDMTKAEHLFDLRDSLSRRDSSQALTGADAVRISHAINSYLHWMNEEFGQTIDPFRLLGEDNFRRYLPVTPLRVRVHQDDTTFEIFARAAAARAAGCRTVISSPRNLAGVAKQAVQLLDELTDAWAAAIEFVEETDDELAEAMRRGAAQRVRCAAKDRVPESVRRASAESYSYIADAPVLAHGRIELLWYIQEQSLSRVYHRYGNLGRRADEERAPVL